VIKRKLLVRSAGLIIVVLIAVLLYTNGKGYTLLLDNKDMEIDGISYQALEMVTVRIDHHEPVELYPRDRDMVLVPGKGHKATVTIYDKQYNEIAAKKLSFHIKEKGEMFLLSFPALAQDAEGWIIPFTPPSLQ